MTGNVQDLLQRASATALATAPPMRRDVDDVVAAGRRRQARQRLLRTGGTAAATVVAVAATVALPRAFDGAAPPSVASSASAPASPAALVYPPALFAYGLRGYTAGPFTVSAPVLVTPGYQELYVRRGDETLNLSDGSGRVVASAPSFSALVTVYRPGVFEPSRYAGGEPVRVNGRPGFFVSGAKYHAGGDQPGSTALAWQYADNAWAVASSVTLVQYTRAELTQIAAGLAGAPAGPATVALKLRWAPAGYVLTSVGATDDYPSGAPYMVSSLRLIRTRPAYTALTEPVDASATGSPTVRIALYPVEFTDDTHRRPGSAAYCNPGNADLCFRMTADGQYLAEVYSSGGLSQADLRRILDEAQFADPARPSTWFPVTQAAPGATG
jgi:hypothetical protein